MIDACAKLDYPKHLLQIQVLDDSDDETVDLVGSRVEFWRSRNVDITHIRRQDRAGFKAGALDEALGSSTGEFIAIFDADFIPPKDFLTVTLPAFDTEDVGMVQTRWEYLNRDWSLITRLQALALDAHFAVEQFVRNQTGCFINFNGTAGVWRRSCIQDAGGWHTDTLTEDLDLSYRAQLAGWRFVYLRRAEAPSELPIAISDLRAQQFRWTKGGIQTARKTIGRILREAPDLKTKLEGVIHLTSHLVFPFLLLAGLLHAPLAYFRGDSIPADVSLALSAVGLAAFGGVFLAQLLAQRSLHSDWPRRIALFPLYLAGSMGLAINNTLAIADAFTGRPSIFVRTPKSGTVGDRGDHNRRSTRGLHLHIRFRPVVALELAMAVYTTFGLGLIAAAGAWSALPFQTFLVTGFWLVGVSNVVQISEVAT